MPNTKTTPATPATGLVHELKVVNNLTLLTVTTIKKSFVKQMPGVLYKDFCKRMKEGTIKVIGKCRGLGDAPDCLVLQLFEDESLCILSEINYREYRSTVGRMDLGLDGDGALEYVNFEVSKIPQLFVT